MVSFNRTLNLSQLRQNDDSLNDTRKIDSTTQRGVISKKIKPMNDSRSELLVNDDQRERGVEMSANMD